MRPKNIYLSTRARSRAASLKGCCVGLALIAALTSRTETAHAACELSSVFDPNLNAVIIFAVDGSGSMGTAITGRLNRLDAVKQVLNASLAAVNVMSAGTDSNSKVALVAFNSRPTTVQRPLPIQNLANIQSLQAGIRSVVHRGQTDILGAIREGVGLFANEEASRNVMILLSDGLHNGSGALTAPAISSIIAQDNVEFSAVAFADVGDTRELSVAASQNCGQLRHITANPRVSTVEATPTEDLAKFFTTVVGLATDFVHVADPVYQVRNDEQQQFKFWITRDERDVVIALFSRGVAAINAEFSITTGAGIVPVEPSNVFETELASFYRFADDGTLPHDGQWTMSFQGNGDLGSDGVPALVMSMAQSRTRFFGDLQNPKEGLELNAALFRADGQFNGLMQVEANLTYLGREGQVGISELKPIRMQLVSNKDRIASFRGELPNPMEGFYEVRLIARYVVDGQQGSREATSSVYVDVDTSDDKPKPSLGEQLKNIEPPPRSNRDLSKDKKEEIKKLEKYLKRKKDLE